MTRRQCSPASAGGARWRGSCRGCAREPDDVACILPFEEVVAALGRTQRARPRRPGDPARLDRRHRRPRSREFDRDFRPVGRRARALGADRRGPPPRRGDAADRRLPDRRAALRQGRPPPRVGGARARRRGHRRVRDRGADQARRRAGDAAARPPAQAARAAVPRARAAAARAARADPALGRVALRAARRCASRRGASARARSAASCSITRARWPQPGSRRSTSRSSQTLREAERSARAARPRATCGSRPALPAPAHARVGRRGDRAAARRGGDAAARRTRWSASSARSCARRRARGSSGPSRGRR